VEDFPDLQRAKVFAWLYAKPTGRIYEVGRLCLTDEKIWYKKVS